ncbi:MAG: radical SAM protein [Pseudonocardiaceae bacterium]
MPNHDPFRKKVEALRAENVGAAILRAVSVEGQANFRFVDQVNAATALTNWRNSLPQYDLKSTGEDSWQLLNCTNAQAGGCLAEGYTSEDTAEPAFSLWLELVERCNLDCLFCYNPWRPAGSANSPLLSNAQLLEAISMLLSSLNIVYVTLAGGEPLMRQDLLQIIKHLSSWSMPIGMATNGRSATRYRLQRYRAAGLTQIAVPVHSHEPDIHDRLTGAKSWHSAVRALAIAQELGYSVTMSTVITRLNAIHVSHLCELVELLALDHYVLNCFHAAGQGFLNNKTLMVSRLIFEHALNEARNRLAPRTKVEIGAPPDQPATRWNRINRVVLSPSGDLKFCVQSTCGVVNLATDDKEAIAQVIALLNGNDHHELISRIDSCTCYGSDCRGDA